MVRESSDLEELDSLVRAVCRIFRETVRENREEAEGGLAAAFVEAVFVFKYKRTRGWKGASCGGNQMNGRGERRA